MLLPAETDEHMLRASTIDSLLAPWIENAKCTVIRGYSSRSYGEPRM